MGCIWPQLGLRGGDQTPFGESNADRYVLLVTWLMNIRKQQISVAGTGQLESQQHAPYY